MIHLPDLDPSPPDPPPHCDDCLAFLDDGDCPVCDAARNPPDVLVCDECRDETPEGTGRRWRLEWVCAACYADIIAEKAERANDAAAERKREGL